MATLTLPSRLLSEKETAELLHVSPGTLSVVRCTRRWPLPYVKIGRAVRYRLTDIEAFMQSRTIAQ